MGSTVWRSTDNKRAFHTFFFLCLFIASAHVYANDNDEQELLLLGFDKVILLKLNTRVTCLVCNTGV